MFYIFYSRSQAAKDTFLKNGSAKHGKRYKAKIVFISKYQYKTAKKLSRYLVSQYVSGQSGFDRYSWSRKELSGFVKCWRHLKRWYRGQELYHVWHRYLARQTIYLKGDMIVWCVKPPPRPSVSEFKENSLDACMKYKAFKQYQKYSVW